MCKVSFITSVYNCEEFIEETIKSVINQTFVDWEYILIDDCSKDKSVDKIKSFKDSRIKLIENTNNRGQSNNLNYGISIAKGDFIARLDHDDLCYPERTTRQLEYMERNPDVDLCGCKNDVWCDGKYSEIAFPPIHTPAEVKYSLTLGINVLAHSSFFIRKESLIRHNIGYGNYRYAEDLDLLFKILRFGKVGFVDETLISYRIFPNQFTQTCGNELIESEITEIRNKYFNDTNLKYDIILKKALFNKGVRTIDEYKNLELACIDYAINCGIDGDTVLENSIVRYMFKILFLEQGYYPTTIIAYMSSKLLSKRWLVSVNGVKFIIACLLCYNNVGGVS